MCRKHTFFAVLGTILFGGFSAMLHGQGIGLDRAIGEALAKNADLRTAEHRMKSERARVWEGISPEFPEVFLEVEGIPRGAAWDRYEERRLGIAQEFEFPLAYAFRGRSRHWEAQRARAGWREVRNRIVADVKKAFYRVLLLEEQVRLQEEIARMTRETVDKAKLRVLAGDASAYDTLKVKVDLAGVENRLSALAAELTVEKVRLGGLMHREDGPVEVTGVLMYSPKTFDVEALKQEALRHHPRLAAAEAERRMENSSRSLAWMGLFPSFQLKYFRMDVPESLPSDRWGGEIGMQIPLWFFTRGQGNIRAAQHRFRAAEYGRASRRREVLLGVERAASLLAVAGKQVENFQENTLQEVEELVRIARRSYEEGEMSYLELNEALRTMDSIRAGYAGAVYGYIHALAELEEAVGKPLDEAVDTEQDGEER